MSKFIFVTGGVVSGIGKGIIAASVGNILSNLGYYVSIMKCDPYLNLDPGTMNPTQHGEVFVTNDGGETDLDLGHYERFLNHSLSKLNNLTAGQAYSTVMYKERSGAYNGGTVQIIPHVTDEIKSKIYTCASQSNCDYLIVELGGTVGDIESQPFIETLRQLQAELPLEHTCYIHVSYIPYLNNVGQVKTKPTQHSCKQLRSLGINPDILVARSKDSLQTTVLTKLSKYCYLPEDRIIPCPDSESLYLIPSILVNNGMLNAIKNKFSIQRTDYNQEFNHKALSLYRINNNQDEFQTLEIAIVGKYSKLQDSYLSIKEALIHSSLKLNVNINITFLDTNNPKFDFHSFYDGVIIPGGFAESGTSTMLEVIEVCYESNIPILGICLGMQLMSIFIAYYLLGIDDCSSSEFHPHCTNPIIDILPEKKDLPIGGTLRLGSYPTLLLENTLIRQAYHTELIYERHRHRYEFNNVYRSKFINDARIYISGLPHPLFNSFLQHCL